MKKREIVRCEEDGCTYLTYDTTYTKPIERRVKPTLAEAVELCDHDAENRNAHDFCGVHKKLAKLIERVAGIDVADTVMREIADYGGLQGMNDIGQH